jgi:type VI secretion system secreted protein VgrG
MNLNGVLSAVTGLTEANRPIRLRLSHDKGVADDLLLVKHVSGVESLCGGLQYKLLCVASQANLPTKQFIAMPAELQFVTDRGALRSVCGIVDSVVVGEADGGLATYQLIVRDALAIMDKGCQSRIFRNKNEIDITAEIIGDWRQNNQVLARAFDFNLSYLKTSYPQREFTMQHNESDAAFLRRLWRRRGLAWFFRAGSASAAGSDDTPAHTLVLFDDAAVLEQNAAGTVRFHRDDGTETRDTITAWQALRQLVPGGVSRQSWDYKTARVARFATPGGGEQGPMGTKFATALEDSLIEAPHLGDSEDDYGSLGMLRMQHHEYDARRFEGESSVRDLCIGQWIGVTGHDGIDAHAPAEREFVITELRVEAENNLPKTVGERVRRLFALNRWSQGGPADPAGTLADANAERGARYSNHFRCVRRGVPIVPSYDPRRDLPDIAPLNVMVVGPQGEEVHCDEQGRVMVRFPGCRPDEQAGARTSNEEITPHDSAWVRVATSWAGAQWGATSLPRVGTACLVDFLGGDPDKPVITAAVHGGTTPPPSFSHVSSLPGDRYLSGIVSREIKGARANQLRLDDTPGEISAQLGSDHAAAQLNLGFLTAPRKQGKGAPRGEGFELRSDEGGSIRTAKALLISAWKRLDAAGNQLSNEEHVALMQDCLDLFKSLGQYAAEHQALALDDTPASALKDAVAGAADGSNVAPGAAKGEPTVSVTAPAGIAVSTPKTIVSYAGVNVDTVAQQHMQLTAGQRFNLNAGKGVSLFAHQDGIVQIAHNGKFVIQSQHDDTTLDSAKDIKATAGKRVVIMAHDEVTLMTGGGAYLKLAGGTVELGGPGALTVKTNGHHWNGPASSPAELPSFGEADLGRTPRLLRPTDGKPVEGMLFHAELPGEGPISGSSGADGKVSPITSSKLQQIKAYFFAPRK